MRALFFISKAYTVTKVWANFTVFDRDAIAKLYICDVKFSQIEGNGRQFLHIAIASSVKFSSNTVFEIFKIKL